MPSRTNTTKENIVTLTSPDNRTFDFNSSPKAPHAIRITIPKDTTYRGGNLYWNETYKVLLKCLGGRCHTFRGTGLYNNVDSFFGEGAEETYGTFELHNWERSENWQITSASQTGEIRRTGGRDEKTPLLMKGAEDHRSDHAQPHSIDEPTEEKTADYEEDLIIELSPSPNFWDQRYGARYELFYRTHASVELDAVVWPTLPSTPLPVRLLFRLPSFLFPALLRNYLISYFLSIQLVVLYSAFDYHPHMGSLPIAFLYGMIFWYKYWLPFGPQLPEWVCRWQWNSMVVVSHLKVAFWARVGSWVLRMKPVYEEYTPDRLKDALDPMPGEMRVKGGGDDAGGVV